MSDNEKKITFFKINRKSYLKEGNTPKDLEAAEIGIATTWEEAEARARHFLMSNPGRRCVFVQFMEQIDGVDCLKREYTINAKSKRERILEAADNDGSDPNAYYLAELSTIGLWAEETKRRERRRKERMNKRAAERAGKGEKGE